MKTVPHDAPPAPSCTGDVLESGSVTYSVLHEGPLPHVLGNMDEQHRLKQLQGSAAAAAAAAMVPPVASSDHTNQARSDVCKLLSVVA